MKEILYKCYSQVNVFVQLFNLFVAGAAQKILQPFLHKQADKYIEKSASFMTLCGQSFVSHCGVKLNNLQR
jgi:hypothetical protein